jgi:putative glutamine amidotransferase
MHKLPRIGISGGLALGNVDHLVQEHKRRAYTADDYVQAVADAEGVPYIIPVIYDSYMIYEQMSVLDGLILSGGEDINPLVYGEEPHFKLEEILPERDDYEKILLAAADEMKIPVLGICRGLQFINVYNGGTLYQDNTLHDGTWIKHSQKLHPDAITHTVDIVKNTWLHDLFGDKVIANSFHHQSIKNVAKGFKMIATARDGVIEGIEREKGSFCVGVQWHPEMMVEKDVNMKKLFKGFANICKKH